MKRYAEIRTSLLLKNLNNTTKYLQINSFVKKDLLMCNIHNHFVYDTILQTFKNHLMSILFLKLIIIRIYSRNKY